ncbi:MAG: peptide deformylase [Saprospiraceae bacterium]|nr:peptide deformylase [Saprospiraceae bacterium]
MILPIFAYGQPVLKKRAETIEKDYPDLDQLIENMWETMYNASGVGLAAPQVGLSKRLFVVDTAQMYEEDSEKEGIKKAFINPVILLRSDEEGKYEEGCLSIPEVQGDVERPFRIRIKYQTPDFKDVQEDYEGLEARVIQHEYDHLEGILFVEKLGPLKKKRVAKKLEKIRRGQITAKYKLKFA